MTTSIFDKIHGCIAASWIGSSMGAITEGLSVNDIVEQFGVLDRLLSFERKGKRFRRPGGPYYEYHTDKREPGMTEDGIERQKLITLAIQSKSGRISVEDYAKSFVEHINAKNFGYLTEPTDELFYKLLIGGVPPAIAGQFSWWPGLGAIARSIHPIGIINACNPIQASRDGKDIARLVQPAVGLGWEYSAAVAAAIAEAMRPEATVDSVINAAVAERREEVKDGVLEDVALVEGKESVWELRTALQNRYGKQDHRLGHVLLGTAFSIFSFVRGNAYEAIIAAANSGIDTDCVAAVVGGLCGALKGTADLPADWIETVDRASKENSKTVSNTTTAETADILFEALQAEMDKTKQQISEIEQQMQEGGEN